MQGCIYELLPRLQLKSVTVSLPTEKPEPKTTPESKMKNKNRWRKNKKSKQEVNSQISEILITYFDDPFEKASLNSGQKRNFVEVIELSGTFHRILWNVT